MSFLVIFAIRILAILILRYFTYLSFAHLQFFFSKYICIFLIYISCKEHEIFCFEFFLIKISKCKISNNSPFVTLIFLILKIRNIDHYPLFIDEIKMLSHKKKNKKTI